MASSHREFLLQTERGQTHRHAKRQNRSFAVERKAVIGRQLSRQGKSLYPLTADLFGTVGAGLAAEIHGKRGHLLRHLNY